MKDLWVSPFTIWIIVSEWMVIPSETDCFECFSDTTTYITCKIFKWKMKTWEFRKSHVTYKHDYEQFCSLGTWWYDG